MKVSAPIGTWKVRRRWAPRRLGTDSLWERFWIRIKSVGRRTADGADIAPDGCIGELGEGIIVAVALIVALLVLIFVAIPLLVALGELLLLLILCLAGVVAKVAFRRPWTVDAISPIGTHHEWQVVGWRASGALRDAVATRIGATGDVPSAAEVAIMTARP